MAIPSMQQGFPVWVMSPERDCRAALAMTKATLERPWICRIGGALPSDGTNPANPQILQILILTICESRYA